MKLSIKKTGGFAGIDLEGEVDTAGFTDKEHQLLQRIFEKDFADRSHAAGVDQYLYEVSLGDQTVRFSANTLLADELPLIKKMENSLKPFGA